jgi:hypothetical protein
VQEVLPEALARRGPRASRGLHFSSSRSSTKVRSRSWRSHSW